jgi:two-component system chemotaxis response regulator CheB
MESAEHADANRDIVVIGASAGGVEALTRLAAQLPADFPAAVFVVLHLSPDSPSRLPELLARAGPLPVVSAEDGEPVRHGRIHVAPPGRHLLLRDGHIALSAGPHENRSRPAIDVLFRSAAANYGGRVIGVLLTGLLDDGTQGLVAVHLAGGVCVVQDPDDATWPAMPRHALHHDHVDHSVALADLSALLQRLVRAPAAASQPLPADILAEDRIAASDAPASDRSVPTPGEPSPIACPECGGVLNQIVEEGDMRFRCQIGHAYTGVDLEDAQRGQLERALAIAERTHRERLTLFRTMLESAQRRGLVHSVQRWRQAADEAERMGSVIEQALRALAARRSD